MPSVAKRIIDGHWMSQEIRKHNSQETYPDWGIKWYSYRDHRNGKAKLFYEKNKEKILESCKKYREKNREAVLERKKIWSKKRTKEYQRAKYLKFKEKIGVDELNRRQRENRKKESYLIWQREYTKKKLATDPGYRLLTNIRRGVVSICRRQGTIKKSKTLDLIGCSVDEFLKHFESQFKNGMTWDNYGTYWHIDHIMPCAVFDHEDERQVKQCWHYTNLRPLTAKENLAKSAKITHPQMSLML